MRVLVTRAAEDAATLSRALAAAGFEPVEVPLLARRRIPGALHEVLAGPFDLLVLTSPATVDAVVDEAPAGFAPPRVAAVGPATAARARERGLRVDLVPDEATGAALAASLGDLSGQQVLYPRALRPTPGTAEALRARGAALLEVACYRNEPPPGFAEALARAWPVEVITLLSGSAARRLAEGLAQASLKLGAQVVVIGPSTEAAARRAGLPVHAVARPHTVEGVVQAVRLLAGSAPGSTC